MFGFNCLINGFFWCLGNFWFEELGFWKLLLFLGGVVVGVWFGSFFWISRILEGFGY